MTDKWLHDEPSDSEAPEAAPAKPQTGHGGSPCGGQSRRATGSRTARENSPFPDRVIAAAKRELQAAAQLRRFYRLFNPRRFGTAARLLARGDFADSETEHACCSRETPAQVG